MHKLDNISILKETTLPDTFIESGSYLGDGIKWALQNGCDNIYSVDIDDTFTKHCNEIFNKENKRVNLYHNSSVDFFARNEIIDVMKNQDCLYWLDGHIHSHKGRDTYTEEGQEFADEFKQAIITAYKDASGSSQNQSPGATSKPKTRAKVAATQTDNSPPTSDADEPARKRKPLWGY